MYKDKAKQREANRQAQARFKTKKVLPEQGITNEGVTEKIVIPSDSQMAGLSSAVLGDNPTGEGYTFSQTVEIPIKSKRGKDIKCFADLPPDEQKAMCEGGLVEIVIGKPGDNDYSGICTPEWIKERKGAAS